MEEASSLILRTVKFKDAIFGLPVLIVDVVCLREVHKSEQEL